MWLLGADARKKDAGSEVVLAFLGEKKYLIINHDSAVHSAVFEAESAIDKVPQMSVVLIMIVGNS